MIYDIDIPLLVFEMTEASTRFLLLPQSILVLACRLILIQSTGLCAIKFSLCDTSLLFS
jgi:hypothetical protein